MAKFVNINELKNYHEFIEKSERGDAHVVLKYGGPCNEHGSDGIRVFYGAPCTLLDSVDFGKKEYIGLRYGAPCTPPYIIVKYGGPCAKLKD